MIVWGEREKGYRFLQFLQDILKSVLLQDYITSIRVESVLLLYVPKQNNEILAQQEQVVNLNYVHLNEI